MCPTANPHLKGSSKGWQTKGGGGGWNSKGKGKGKGGKGGGGWNPKGGGKGKGGKGGGLYEFDVMGTWNDQDQGQWGGGYDAGQEDGYYLRSLGVVTVGSRFDPIADNSSPSTEDRMVVPIEALIANKTKRQVRRGKDFAKKIKLCESKHTHSNGCQCKDATTCSPSTFLDIFPKLPSVPAATAATGEDDMIHEDDTSKPTATAAATTATFGDLEETVATQESRSGAEPGRDEFLKNVSDCESLSGVKTGRDEFLRNIIDNRPKDQPSKGESSRWGGDGMHKALAKVSL